MARSLRSDLRGSPALAIADVLASLAAASLIVALVDQVAPAASLTIVYLLAVLFVAVRRGSWAALATSVLGLLLFNFLFIEPRFGLGVSSSGDLVTLTLFFVVSIVVGRLAATARRRSELAEEATSIARAREREARILAQAASAVLAADDEVRRGESAVAAVAAALPDDPEGGLRITIGDRPTEDGLCVVRLEAPSAIAWLSGDLRSGWDAAALGRLAGPLAEICHLVEERSRLQEQRAVAETARRAETAKTALLHAVSHDLRSPLTAISTAASAMNPERLPDGDHEALLAVIKEESERLSRLVDDLLDVSRIEAAAVDPNKDWCHVNEVAARAVAAVRRRSAHPIEVALPDDVLLIQADSVQLERVLVNLLDNAVRHSPADAVVRLSGGVGGGRVHIRVIDRGRGIPLSRRGQVFEPFFRGRGSEGSGLGLTICRGFTEANGGSIRIDDAAGGGTSIAVSFPLAPEPSPA